MSKVIELYKLTLLSFFFSLFFFLLCPLSKEAYSDFFCLLQRVTCNKVLSLTQPNLCSDGIKQVYAKQKMVFRTELPPLKPESMTLDTKYFICHVSIYFEQRDETRATK